MTGEQRLSPADEARLRTVESWASVHEERCTGRHEAIRLRMEELRGDFADARAEAALARAEAKEGRVKILSWVRFIFIVILVGVVMLVGSQAKLGQLASILLGVL